MRGRMILDVGVIEAEHGEAVERDARRELDEGLLELVVRSVVIEVLGIDVGHDRTIPTCSLTRYPQTVPALCWPA